VNTMPLELVLIRHGESEGNEAGSLWRKGVKDLFTKDFLDRHSSEFRLTDRGCDQAILTGSWIRENIGETFDFYGTSEYVRAIETAGLLDLPGALWQRDLDLRERDHGFADLLHPDTRSREYAKELKRFKKNPLINPVPGGGESIAQMRQRSWRIFSRLRRKIPDGRAILVCHGEFIWGCRIDLEHITMDKFLAMRKSKNPHDNIYNCQVLQYSRINPHNGMVSDYYTWMRSYCPSAPEWSSDKWIPIVRKKFTNEELLAEAGKHRRRIS
jgi:broad specificity phosphatase PhoE